MSRLPSSIVRRAVRSTLTTCAAALLLSASLLAQINISGAIADGSGGPLLAGQTYIVVGSLSVSSGQTLTIQQGATVKFNPGTQMSISGIVNVTGTSGARVTFSSSVDDTAGGDTNGDGGATTPAPGNWRGLLVQTNGSLHLAFADLRYGGNAGFSPVHVSGAGTNLSMLNSTVEHSLVDGLQLSGVSYASFSVAGCSFDNNAQFPVALTRLELLPNFSSNTASGNGSGDYIQVTNGSVPSSTDQVVTLDQLLNGVLVLGASVTIPSTSSLTLPAGLVVKMLSGMQISVSGAFTANGTVGSPVIITSIHNDVFLGDTNKNGTATVPAPGDWRGVIAQTASSVVMTDTAMYFGGNSGFSPVHVNGAGTTLSLTDCLFRDSLVDGLQLSGLSFNQIDVSGCVFVNNAQFPVSLVRLEHLPKFSNNSAVGNGSGDYVQVTNGSVPASTALDIELDQLLNGILVMGASVTVPSSSSLSLPPGLVVKMAPGSQVSVSGTFASQGTDGAPIVITSIHDDTVAGDTNKNGAMTTAAAGDWRGVIAQSNSTVTIEETEMVYGGNAGFSPVHVNGANTNLSLTNSLLRDSLVDALQLSGLTFTSLNVSGCTFDNNDQFPVATVRLDLLENFSNNSASGNDFGDYIQVTSGSLAGSTTASITFDQLLNDVLVMSSGITISTSALLRFPAGLVVKMPAGAQISVSGTLDFAGTGESPVVITSILDDTAAGDTNKDGAATLPAPGNWRGCIVQTAGVLDMDHAIVRYGGNAGFAPIYINTSSATVMLDAVRAEYSLVDGFFLQDADWVRDCVAWLCDQDGFDLRLGAFDVMRCTAVGNGGVGVRKAAGHSGQVTSTVSWNNVGGNYDGFDPGELANSLGDLTLAGSDGNVNTDPLFVNEPGGDLRLTATSLCVDNGDPTDKPTGFDLAGFPRLIDGSLNFNRTVDMGAYEFDNIEMALTGVPNPGSTIFLDLTGKAGMNTYIFLGIATFELSFKTFGPLTVDLGQPSLIFGFTPLPSSVPLAIPLDFPVGIPVYAQALGLDGVSASDPGNMSNGITIIAE